MADVREKLVELLNNSFAEQYEKRGLLTAPHTATDLIAHGVTIQRWIPVTERLPDERGFVLVFTVDKTVGEAFVENDGQFYWSNMDEYSSPLFVTHWMPLPEAPEKE